MARVARCLVQPTIWETLLDGESVRKRIIIACTWSGITTNASTRTSTNRSGTNSHDSRTIRPASVSRMPVRVGVPKIGLRFRVIIGTKYAPGPGFIRAAPHSRSRANSPFVLRIDTP